MAKRLDIRSGDVFGDYTVVTEVPKTQQNQRRFLLRCVCGTEKELDLPSFKYKNSGCGCRSTDKMVASKLKREDFHGMTGSPEHKSWAQTYRR